MLIAVVHIVGALLVGIVFLVIALAYGNWLIRRSGTGEVQAIATQLGITVEEIEEPANLSRVISLASERFNNDRLSNRLSDLVGWLQAALDWLVMLIQIATFAGIIWLTATDSPANAVYVWIVPTISFLMLVERALVTATCRLLTGRYPGQAKVARNGLAEFLKAQR